VAGVPARHLPGPLLALALTLAATADAHAQSPAELVGLDLVALDYRATIDPETGAASGAIDITVRVASAQAAPKLRLALDAGLDVTAATVDARDLTVQRETAHPLRTVAITLAPAPEVGDELVVHVAYEGALACEVSSARGHRACGVGGAVGYLRLESVLPRVWDGGEGAAYELFRRTLALTLPEGVVVIGAGDIGSTTTDGDAATHTWSSDVVHVGQDLVVVFGALASLEVPRASPDETPITVWYAADDPDWTTEMRDWTAAAMPLLEALAGSPLPFAQVALVELPRLDGFNGTATSNMVLLSESYGDALGPGWFEQTLAHELSHLWWGNVAWADEASWWLVEGLARHAELEVMAERYPLAEPGFAAGDGAGRSRWHANLVRYVLTEPPPLVLAHRGLAPTDPLQFSAWAYALGAATLEHLRVVVGDAAFAIGLSRWASECAFRRCTSADFQALMEEAGERDLAALFAQHVTGATFPEVAWSFTQAPAADGSDRGDDARDVTLSFTQTPAATSTLELWVEGEGGAIDKHLVDLVGAAGRVTLTASGPVLRVAPNPYHDPIVHTRSAVDGDVDFDGAVDGVDLVRCAEWVTFGFPPVQSAANLFEVNPVDFRCDVDHSGAVDRVDLELLGVAFGTLEPGAGGAP